MRVVLVLFLAMLLLAGCKREAQEAVAQAKGAAADAERAAKDAAAQARNAADQAASTARSAADQAKAAADDAAAKAHATAEQARVAATGASDSAKQTRDSTGQRLREMTAGDQLLGVLVEAGNSELSVRPPSGPARTFHTDLQTRWILHGAGTGRDGFRSGSTVRVTYIVTNGQRLATQVEAVPP